MGVAGFERAVLGLTVFDGGSGGDAWVVSLGGGGGGEGKGYL